MPDIHELIKKMAVQAVEESKPVNLLYGTVSQEFPLEIKIDSKFTLPEEFIVVSDHLTDKVLHGWCSDGAVTVNFDNSLKAGDRVIMIQEQGGQRFIVLDRTVK